MHAVVPAVIAFVMVAVVFLPAVSLAQTAQDTLIVGVQNDTPNLTPWDTTTNSVWKSFIWRRWVFEGLFNLRPDGTYYPLLANDSRIGPNLGQRGWDADASGLNITVYIRQGLTFTDGAPLNAADVLFSFELASFNSQLSTSLLPSIVWSLSKWTRWNATSPWAGAHLTHVGVERIDDFTVVFHLASPYSLFFEGVLTTPIMPSHIWSSHVVAVDISKYKLTGEPEFDFDRSFGAGTSPDTRATIGTGPFKLDFWVPTSSAQISTYSGYWGKGKTIDWNGKNWPFFPVNIRHIQFKIFGSFDVVVLALQKGDIHLAPWRLSITQWNNLKQSPSMGFLQGTEDGFFYIAFNLRRSPMNNLAFRQAVAYSIDKDFIVNRLLGGFGIKGNLPVSPLNPAYINSSATVPAFDLNQAKAVLNAAGIIDRDGDGWRDMPDGTPIKLTILTPAKDYDPVRADAGIMISNNLKSIGLNIDSAPTAFDAIVAAAFVSVEFDMYILGWVNLGPFPEFYLRDFFGCDTDAKLGLGDNTPGYCNSAVQAQLDILDHDTKSANRQTAAKIVEGYLARDLPYDTLYIRTNIEGFRQDVWQGWVEANGEIFNSFSIAVLGPPGVVPPPSGPLKVSLEVPATVRATTNLVGQIFTDQNGLPAAGATVNVSTSFGAYQVVTTDSKGYAAFSIPVPFIAGAFGVQASGSIGSPPTVGGDAATVIAIIPNPFAKLTLWSDTPLVTTNGTATIHAKVTDRFGKPIVGASLSTIPILTFGAVSPSSIATDANGLADFSYKAPPSTLIPNENLMDTVQVTVNAPNTVLPDVSKATYVMGVTNPVTKWDVIRVTNINAGVGGSVPVVDTDATTLTIPSTVAVTVTATNQTGGPIANENVSAVFTSTALSVTPGFQLTDAAGHATFTFTAQSSASTAVNVTFTAPKASKSVDTLVILVANQAVAAQAWWLDVGPTFGPARSTYTVTAHVYNQTGLPAVATKVYVFSPYSDAGESPRFAGGKFYRRVGSLWNGSTDTTGTVRTTADWSANLLQGTFVGDSLVSFETGIKAVGPLACGIFGTGNPDKLPAVTPCSNGYTVDTGILARAPLAVLAQGSLNKPEFSIDDNSGRVGFRFRNLAGPVSKLSVAIYRGTGDLRCPPTCTATKVGDFLTSTSGWVNITWSEPVSPSTIPAGFTAVVTDNRYALGGQFGSVPFETVYPYIADPRSLIVTGTTQAKLVSAGQTDTFSLTVTDIFGNSVAGASVSGGSVRDVTGSTGQVNLTVSTAAGINNIVFTAWTSDGRFGSARLGTYGGLPVVGLSGLTISNAKPVRGDKVYVNATVANTGPVTGTFVIDLKVDGATVYQKTVTVPAGGTAPVSFVWVPTDTAAHTVTIGTLTGQTVTATLPPGPSGVIDSSVAIGLAVGTLVAGFIVGMLLGRRGGGKKPSASMPKEEKPGAAAEEELPPEI